MHMRFPQYGLYILLSPVTYVYLACGPNRNLMELAPMSGERTTEETEKEAEPREFRRSLCHGKLVVG